MKLFSRFLSKTLLPALALAALSGCATVKQAPAGDDAAAKRFEAPAGLSRIYIYRNEFLGTLVGLDLTVDGQVAGITKGKTFVVADVPAGPHQIVSKGENSSSLSVTAEAGQPLFVWQEVKMGLLSAGSRLHSVDAATGRAGVLETSLVHSPLMRAAPAAQAAAPAPASLGAEAADRDLAAAAAAPAAAATPAAVAAPAAAAAIKPAAAPAPSHLGSSRFEFEAERAAIERGCRGPAGIRPSARLLAREGQVELFEMSCPPLRVRCDTGMCSVVE